MFATATALALTLTANGGSGLPPQPTLHLAQEQADYSDWIYLYADSFETNGGTEVTQNWWLDPDLERIGDTVRFTLLSRRSPVSANGTAAGVFGYIANCETISYALEDATFLDSQDEALETQTYQTALRAADPESAIYPHLVDICAGAYDS